MRDIRRDNVMDDLCDVVGQAIRAGISPDEFKKMCAEAWRIECDAESERAAGTFLGDL